MDEDRAGIKGEADVQLGRKLTRVDDRNANPTTVTPAAPTGCTSYDDLTVVGSASTIDARTAKVQTDAADTRMWQQGPDWYRGVRFTRTGNDMTTFADAMSRNMVFTYTTAWLLSKTQAPDRGDPVRR